MEEKGSRAREEKELLWISSSSNNNNNNNKEELAARPGKRDEWSDAAVAALLDAYEAKWALRNRAKLKGHDWEDVARAVSCRAGDRSCKGPKTATQCKNKVESMKKRYRSEAAVRPAVVGGSKWPLFHRLDGLVRCRGVGAAAEATIGLESEEQHEQSAAPAVAPAGEVSLPKADGDAVIVEGECGDTPAKENGNEATNNKEVQGNSTQSNDDGSREKRETAKNNRKRKRRKEQKDVMSEVIRSIQYFAEVVLKVEHARMEAMREVEMIRAEAEAKRGEMDLKRTEIIASTQLQIARLFAKNCGNI
ncbi:Trihelix transcription factor ASIL2 [Ananas comosus]|uniref:Trihelix transcription factor ASIL2 n=1 Tax=Ananas comosus TaxID=4615 RepID=A0A199VYF6_ANACO|nr:Trihelix transcription factor ASIL2 [Ananas comosus]